jgi:hypothetical protein
MSDQRGDEVDVLRTLWAAEGRSASPVRDELDEACGPTKACKNMQHVSFDGMAEPGTNLREAWRERLEREGKLSTAGGSIRDLVLGSGDTR